jgi:hypothetical protein
MPFIITYDTSLNENSGIRFQTGGTGNLGVYIANGLAFTPRLFGLGTLDALTIFPMNGYSFEVDYANQKIKAYRNANDGSGAEPNVEVQAGIDLSGVTFRWQAAGV